MRYVARARLICPGVADDGMWAPGRVDAGETIRLRKVPAASFKTDRPRPPDEKWFRTQDETFSQLVEQLSAKIPDMTDVAYPDGVPAPGTCPKACIADGWHEESLYARTHGRHGSMAKALAYYQRAVLLAPDNAAANHYLGAAVWQEQRDADLAGKLLGRAVQLNPMSLLSLNVFHQVASEVVMDAGGEGSGQAVKTCNVTVHQKARFREVLTWVEGRIEEVMAAVKKRRDAEIAQSNGNDVPGEGFCETILRRAVDQTMQDIPQVRQGMNRPLLLISRPLLLISRPFLTLTQKCMTRRKAELRYASVRRSLLP